MPYPYFIQDPDWLNFWKQVRGKSYNYFWQEQSFNYQNYNFKISSAVYEYIWYFNKKFWCINKGPLILVENAQKEKQNLNKLHIPLDVLEKQWQEWLTNLVEKALSHSVSFLKFSFDDSFVQKMQWSTESDMVQFLKKYSQNFLEKQKTKIFFPSEEIDYSICTFIPLYKYYQEKDENLSENQKQVYLTNLDYIDSFYQKPISSTDKEKFKEDLLKLQSLDLSNLENNFNWQEWYQTSLMQNLYANFNQRVRRYTRKSLELLTKNWKIKFLKTESNFNKFWQTHLETVKRQKFITQPKKNLLTMLNQNFGRLIIVENAEQGQSVFLGIKIGKTLTYLFGGNSQKGMDEHSQYLLQLAALTLALKEGCFYYDLGGYKIGSGFANFKDGYRGLRRQFFGPVDLVFKPLEYQTILNILKLKKFFLG